MGHILQVMIHPRSLDSQGVADEAHQVPRFVTGGEVILRLTVVSPVAARTLLSRAHASSKRRDDAVQTYSHAMREGCWTLNGSPIVLSSNRSLLDGFQRLTACVETGIPLQTFLAENVGEDCYFTIDQHQRRTFAGALKGLGYAHPQLLSHLIYQLARYDEGTLAEKAPPLMDGVRMLRILKSHTGFRQALNTVMGPPAPLPASVLSVLAFMGYQTDAALTDRFLDALRNPAAYPPHEPGGMLAADLKRGRDSSTHTWDSTVMLALGIKALNAMIQGSEVRRLTWSSQATSHRPAEPFPSLIGYPGLAGLGMLPATTQDDTAGISWRMEAIDAGSAAQYLAQGHAGRAPTPGQVDALAEDIRQGAWQANGQPICFSRSGMLLNGQNRLLAIMAAGKPVEVAVIQGLPDEAAVTYDLSPRRELPSTFQDSKFGDQPLATAMANLLWRFEHRHDGARHKRASTAEIRAILTQHPRLVELRGFARKMVEYGRSSVMGYGAYVIERDDPRLAAGFLHALSTGTDLSAGHPILALRVTLQRLRRENASQVEQLNALLAGWRRYKAHPVAERSQRDRRDHSI
jgi:hypothetical protein